ncbi:MAG TPA: methionine--tRNA ligase [Oligoflexia bacterium]|nr:methionine--tRNA ligase [Oligoflexia bacterium]HMP47286.1 methionine--tRNA ligase [Oligoflexia bacterium]
MNNKPKDIAVFVAWPYANGDLHIGHLAGAYLPADIFARYHRLRGNRVLMASGSDSHGTPITLKAKQEKTTPKEIVEHYHKRIMEDFISLGISFNIFTLTLTRNHADVVSEIFLKLKDNGDLEVKEEEQFFDEKEQMFLPDRYVNGTCPFCGNTRARGDECEQCGKTYDVTEILNPVSTLSGTVPQIRKTEHFFFNLQSYQDSLREFVDSSTHWRNSVQNFTRSWVEEGLRPRAITRDIDWGIPVPLKGWESKVIYVWFEAVIGYLSATREFGNHFGDSAFWETFWKNKETKSYYFIGKDNIPFHTVIWPVELMAYDAQMNLPYDVPANQFLNIEGEKFSTSRGTAVWVRDILEKVSPDALRYYVTSILPETKDSNFAWDELKARNNGELAAAWGNLVNRVMGFAASKFEGKIPSHGEFTERDKELYHTRDESFKRAILAYEEVRLRDALKEGMGLAREVNKYLDEEAPWTKFKSDPVASGHSIYVAISVIQSINILLAPVLPFSAEQIYSAFGGEGDLFPKPELKSVQEESDMHDIMLMNCNSSGKDRFEHILPESGRSFNRLSPLFAQIE